MDEEEAYESLLSIVEFDSSVLDLLRALSRSVDVDELLERWEREHLTNGAGRIEARVYLDDSGEWVADPKVGFAGPRRFPSERAARVWILSGGHYEVPAR